MSSSSSKMMIFFLSLVIRYYYWCYGMKLQITLIKTNRFCFNKIIFFLTFFPLPLFLTACVLMISVHWRFHYPLNYGDKPIKYLHKPAYRQLYDRVKGWVARPFLL